MGAPGGGPVRVAVVGAGWWGSAYHVPALAAHPDALLVAVCDVDRTRARDAVEQTGGQGATPVRARTFTDLGAALDAVELDAVVVATPSAAHHGVAVQAIDARLHVLVEKPLALTADDAFDLVRRSERAGIELSVGYTAQHAPAARFARDMVRTRIGRLVQVTVEFSSSAGELFAAAATGGTMSRGQHPAAYSAANGGGMAHTQLSHALGMLTWATGEEVAVIGGITATHGLEVDVDDAFVFRLRGGATGVAVATGTVRGPLPARQHIRYQGTEGVVEQDMLRARTVLYRADGSRLVREPGQHEPAYRAGEPARAFVDLVRGAATENPAPARPAAAAVAAVETALRAAHQGGLLPVPPLPPS